MTEVNWHATEPDFDNILAAAARCKRGDEHPLVFTAGRRWPGKAVIDEGLYSNIICLMPMYPLRRGSMRILLRRQHSGLYLQPSGEWKASRETAREFEDGVSAYNWAKEGQLSAWEVLLAFADSRDDFVSMRDNSPQSSAGSFRDRTGSRPSTRPLPPIS